MDQSSPGAGKLQMCINRWMYRQFSGASKPRLIGYQKALLTRIRIPTARMRSPTRVHAPDRERLTVCLQPSQKVCDSEPPHHPERLQTNPDVELRSAPCPIQKEERNFLDARVTFGKPIIHFDLERITV